MKLLNFMLKCVILFTLFTLFSSVRLKAQDTLYITGTVQINSEPVSFVWVILYDGEIQKGIFLTGDDGKYYIQNLQAKTYTIVVRRSKRGSDLFSKEVVLPDNKDYDINIP